MSCIHNVANKIIVKNIKKENDVSSESESLLLEACDTLTLVTVATQPQAFIEQSENSPTDADVFTNEVDLGWKKYGSGFGADWRKIHLKELRRKVSPNFSTSVLGEDDMFSKYTCFEKIIGEAIRNTVIFPMIDSATHTDSDEVLRAVKLAEGQAQPSSYNTDFDMQSDESFSRIFFFGMGATLLAAQDDSAIPRSDLGPFMVDIPLQEMAVRPGFKRLGCRIYFSHDQKVSAIFDYAQTKTIKSGEEGWDQAKWLAKVTTFFFVTAREHLVWTHLIVSNAATRESIVHLPPNHSLRRLLTIFTYRTTEVNTSAFDALVPDHSLLHRSSAFTYPSMKKIFDSAYLASNAFEPFPERKVNSALMELVDQGKFPFVSEGIEYYQIVEDFVRDWIARAGEENVMDPQGKMFYEGVREASSGQKYEIPEYEGIDNIVKVVTQIIFTVTAYHELVGNVVDYTAEVDRAGFRISNGSNETTLDVQALMLQAVISASTSVRMPQLMSEFPNFFSAGGAPAYERKAWSLFLDKLKTQSEKVKAADAERDVEFKYFDPARFECSVSV
jgi:hypothetical protein